MYGEIKYILTCPRSHNGKETNVETRSKVKEQGYRETPSEDIIGMKADVESGVVLTPLFHGQSGC